MRDVAPGQGFPKSGYIATERAEPQLSRQVRVTPGQAESLRNAITSVRGYIRRSAANRPLRDVAPGQGFPRSGYVADKDWYKRTDER